MLVEGQKIIIHWNTKNREWYEQKGYSYSGNSEFEIRVEDLSLGSHIKVKCKCDFCNNIYTLEYRDYIKNLSRNYGKFHCFKCHFKNCAEIPKNFKDTGKNRKRIKDVIDVVESKNQNILLNPEDYINVNKRNLKVLCGSCGEVYITSLASIKASQGACSKCGVKKSSGNNKLTKDEVENRINALNNNCLINPDEYFNNSTPNLKIRCGECGEIFTTTLANYEYNGKIRCDSCSQRISIPERKVINILEVNNILYKYNYRFDDCKDKRALPFDFYLPFHNLIIETDGEHHFRPKWSNEQFITTKKHDQIKNEYCKTNNIRLVRIPFWDFDNIEGILIKELNLNKKKKKIITTGDF